MANKVIIIGGKGTAVNIAEQIIDAAKNFESKVEFLGYSIDDESLGDSINGYPILCKTKELRDKYNHQSDVKFIFALYKPEKLKERTALLSSYGIEASKFTNFVHPSVYLSGAIKTGTGNVILSNSSVHYGVEIGNYNIINSNTVIEHETKLGSTNFIAASVCIGAKVNIGNGCFIGLNSTIKENVTISDYSFVGMASNVLQDVGEGQTVFGNPARVRNK